MNCYLIERTNNIVFFLVFMSLKHIKFTKFKFKIDHFVKIIQQTIQK
jgi:hypothetical protein